MSDTAIRKLAEAIVDEAILSEIERSNMPQVKEGQTDALVAYAEEMGLLTTRERVDPADLKATQEDYSQSKVDALVDKILEDNKLRPSIVSKSYAILDGHHRGRAVRKANSVDDGSRRLPVVRLHLETEAALQLIRDFEKRSEDSTEGMEHVVVQAGRFHPFHAANYATYEALCDRFGKNNVYIATSGRTSPPKMPFSFKEKQRIISKMYPVPKGQVVEVANAYNPEEVLEDRDPESTCFVMALNEDDIQTLEESDIDAYFASYDADSLRGFGERGYYFKRSPATLEVNGKEVDDSNIRAVFSDDDISQGTKRAFFKEVFGSFDEEIFALMIERFNPDPLPEDVVEAFVSENRDMLREVTRTAAAKVDDGPATWYDSIQGQRDEQDDLARRMGLQVVDYLEGDVNTDLKRDSLPYASFYPAGDDPNFSPSVSDPDSVWASFISAVATQSGHRIIDWLGARNASEYDRRARDTMPSTQKPGRDPGRTFDLSDMNVM